jgi:hypothetical protein
VRVLVVCEDPTHDQYIVKPVLQRLLKDVRPAASVEVLPDARLGGIDDLLRELPAIVADNWKLDLFVVIADRDGDRRNNTTRTQDAAARATAGGGKPVVACCAVEEVETWMLALYRNEVGALWTTVRADCDVKDRAEAFLKRKEFGGPGRGRKAAMRALSGQWQGLLQLCDEIGVLRDRIAAALVSRS